MLAELWNKRKIKKYKKRIEELEVKLSRSQSSYIQAMLVGSEPDPSDMEYHKKYMDEIRSLRCKIRKLQNKE